MSRWSLASASGVMGGFLRERRPPFYRQTNEKPSYLLCDRGSRKGTEKSFLFLMSLLSGGVRDFQ